MVDVYRIKAVALVTEFAINRDFGFFRQLGPQFFLSKHQQNLNDPFPGTLTLEAQLGPGLGSPKASRLTRCGAKPASAADRQSGLAFSQDELAFDQIGNPREFSGLQAAQKVADLLPGFGCGRE